MRTLSASIITAKDAVEKGVVYLLEIELEGATLLYTNYETDISFGGQIYYSKGFVFPEGPHGTSLSYQNVQVTIANVDGAISQSMVANEMRGRALRLKLIFMDKTGAPIGGADDYIDIIEGIVEHGIVNQVVASISVKSRLAALEKKVPTRNYGAACAWVFGGTECTFDTGSTKLTLQTADSGSTASKIVDAARTEADDYWKDGIVEMTSGDNNGEKRRVLSNTSGEVVLEHAFPNVIGDGDTYSIEQGCDKQYSTCETRFGNEANFGGFVSLPREIIKE